MTTLDAAELRRLDGDHCWHPLFQHGPRGSDNPLLVFERGEGCTLYDAEGRSYLDAGGGLWNVNVGYGRREISEAAFEQLQRLPFYPHSQINAPAARLAARLAGLLPGALSRTFYTNSGSEANETAFKIARQCQRQRHPGQDRYKILARYQGYHGFTMGALSATGQVGRRLPYEPLVPGLPARRPAVLLPLSPAPALPGVRASPASTSSTSASAARGRRRSPPWWWSPSSAAAG